MKVLYCDNCGIDSHRYSKVFYETGWEVYEEGSHCPKCNCLLEWKELKEI